MNTRSGTQQDRLRREGPWKPLLRWLTAFWKATLGYRPERRYMRGDRRG